MGTAHLSTVFQSLLYYVMHTRVHQTNNHVQPAALSLRATENKLLLAKYSDRNRDAALTRDFDTAFERRVAKMRCSIEAVAKSPITDAKSSWCAVELKKVISDI